MAKVLRCDDCGEIYSPHDGRPFGLARDSQDGDTVLTVTPTRVAIHTDDMAKTIETYPIDLCRKCLISHATKIFAEADSGPESPKSL